MAEPADPDAQLQELCRAGSSAAIGLVDVVLEPRGFEAGYTALIAGSTRVRRGDVEIQVGGLADLIRSKELLRRVKDIEHLVVLYEQFPELAPGSQSGHSERQ